MAIVEARRSTSLRLKKGLYEYVRERAKKDGRSVNNFLERIISKAVEYPEPNEETKLAIEEARRERPYLKRYETSKDLLEDLMAD